MDKSVIEVTPKKMFGYILFCVGLVLIVYVAIQCYFLANGTLEPLKIEVNDEITLEDETVISLGILLQTGMYALLIAIAFILMKTGLNIARTTS